MHQKYYFICALLLLQILFCPVAISASSSSVPAFSSTVEYNTLRETVSSSVSTQTVSSSSTPATSSSSSIPTYSSSSIPTATSTATTATSTATTNTTTPQPTTTTTTSPPATTTQAPEPNQVSTCYAYPSLSRPCVKLCLKHSERIVLNIQYDDTNGMRREFLTGVPQNTSVAISGQCAKAKSNGKSFSRISMRWPLNAPYSYAITLGFKRNDKDSVSGGKTSYKGSWWLSDLKLSYSNASRDPMFIDPILNFSTVSYYNNAQTYTDVRYSYYCPEELEVTMSNASVHSSVVQLSMGEYILQGFNMTSSAFSATHVCNTEEEEEEVVNLIAVGVATGLAVLVGVILVVYIAGRIWKRKKQASSYEVLA